MLENVFSSSAVAEPKDPTERRAEHRYSTGDCAAEVFIPGTDISFQGTVMDVSRSGLRIRTESHLDARTTVRVKLAQLVVEGEVRYSKPNEHGSRDLGVLVLRLCSSAAKT